MKHILFSLVLSFFVISCSNNANQFLIDDYEIDNGDVSLAILTIESDYHFNKYPNHIFGALRPIEREIFDFNLSEIIASKIGPGVNGVLDSHIQFKNNFEMRSFHINNRELEAIAPKAGEFITSEDNKEKFVLLFDQFYFTPYQVEVGGDSYAGHESETEQRLRFETVYILWDNDLGDAIGWGKINTNGQFSNENPRNTYIDLLEKAVDQILNVSPFIKIKG